MTKVWQKSIDAGSKHCKVKNTEIMLLSPPSVNVVNIREDYEIGRSMCPLFHVVYIVHSVCPSIDGCVCVHDD